MWMKKSFVIISIALSVLLSGCSAETNLSPAADQLDAALEQLIDQMEQLEEKESLTENDQKIIFAELNHFQEAITDFEKTKAPFFLRKIQKLTIEELQKREQVLLIIKQKAKKGTATQEDVRIIQNTLSDDFKISLFDK
ncbi:hypothetical protein AC623_04075 [Bacillus sp. FJAT-27231]|uniref:hypothetical protein n=1 Tax=Bacillus sp. FJAT-27231 TaxID=1679168 RepID=UPI000670B35C|nr:hypothetical protein [Bacillus sp. FJAT-27231]KMY53267.1 hypothetical protein AC623_04075 [Bacillus sp. FJAT-27231]